MSESGSTQSRTFSRRQLIRVGGTAIGAVAVGTAGNWVVNSREPESEPGGASAPRSPLPPRSPGHDEWQAAVDTNDYAAIEEWYATHTGHEALGITSDDLEPGSLTSEYDGQIIEGIRGSHIRVAHDNVTIRGCRVEGGALHGAYFDPTHNADIVGTVVEYCTYDGGLSDVRANYWSGRGAGAVVTRYSNIFGWRAGHTSVGGATFEYCWVHDLSAPDDAHRTGMQISGADSHYRRNYITDGGSGCAAAYFDVSPMHNCTVEENILNGSSPNASPSYLINMKSGEHSSSATNIKVIGNMFGTEYQYGPFSDANIPWGTNGNLREGNRWFGTSELVGND